MNRTTAGHQKELDCFSRSSQRPWLECHPFAMLQESAKLASSTALDRTAANTDQQAMSSPQGPPREGSLSRGRERERSAGPLRSCLVSQWQQSITRSQLFGRHRRQRSKQLNVVCSDCSLLLPGLGVSAAAHATLSLALHGFFCPNGVGGRMHSCQQNVPAHVGGRG